MLIRFINGKNVLALVLAGVTIAAWALWPARANPKDLYVVQPVAVGDLAQTVSANGTLNPVALVRVGTQVSGTVTRLRANYNDRVAEGQVLAELDDSMLRAQAEQSAAGVRVARANLDLAVANETRQRSLAERGFISRQGLDQALHATHAARAQHELAEAQLRKDRTNLGYAVIRSPVAGVVVDRQVDTGQTVAANFQTPTLFLIARDLRRMQIDTSFAEADIAGIRADQPVQFKVDAFPGKVFAGKVERVRLNPANQQNVVTYDIVVAVDNPDEALLPGMTAYVTIVVARRSGVLTVPNAALRFQPSGAAPAAREAGKGNVYVMREDGIRPVEVTTGISDGNATEIAAGSLGTADRVVVAAAAGAGAAAKPGRFQFRFF